MAEKEITEAPDDTEGPETTEESVAEETAEEGEPEEPASTEAASELPVSPLASARLAFFQQDYEAAAEQFAAVLEDDGYDEDSRAKAAYWRVEALTERQFSEKNIALFEEVAERFPEHYLAAAAQRRAEALRRYFAAVKGEQDAEE